MAERRHYDARTKARAVGIAVLEGVTQAERETGIPKETIQYWTHDPLFAHLRTRARDEVMVEWWAGLQSGARALIKGMDDPDVPVRDKSQAFLALAQNYQLMSGQATSRSESKDLTADLDDHERATLRAVLDDVLEKQPA